MTPIIFYQVEFDDGATINILSPSEDDWAEILESNPELGDDDYDSANLEHVRKFAETINNSYIVKITREFIN